MIKLYSPQNEIDLALIRSILDGDDIPFFVHNDHFGSLRIGPAIELYNAKTIMVNEKDYTRASELVSDYLKNTESQCSENNEFHSEYSLFDKIRVIIKTILFGWTVPGKSNKQRQLEED